jgi:hypothetical protein
VGGGHEDRECSSPLPSIRPPGGQQAVAAAAVDSSSVTSKALAARLLASTPNNRRPPVRSLSSNSLSKDSSPAAAAAAARTALAADTVVQESARLMENLILSLEVLARLLQNMPEKQDLCQAVAGEKEADNGGISSMLKLDMLNWPQDLIARPTPYWVCDSYPDWDDDASFLTQSLCTRRLCRLHQRSQGPSGAQRDAGWRAAIGLLVLLLPHHSSFRPGGGGGIRRREGPAQQGGNEGHLEIQAGGGCGHRPGG